MREDGSIAATVDDASAYRQKSRAISHLANCFFRVRFTPPAPPRVSAGQMLNLDIVR